MSRFLFRNISFDNKLLEICIAYYKKQNLSEYSSQHKVYSPTFKRGNPNFENCKKGGMKKILRWEKPKGAGDFQK